MKTQRMNKRTRYYLEQGYHGFDFSTEHVLSEESTLETMKILQSHGYIISLTTYVNGYNRLDTGYIVDYNGKYGKGYAFILHSYDRHDYSVMYLLTKARPKAVDNSVDTVDNPRS